jgi:hypothetical protein
MLLWLTPRPLELLHLTGALSLLPPLWLLVVVHLLWYAAVGALMGVMWGERSFAGGETLWRGITYLMWGATGVSVWYVLLFGKGLFLLSWLCLPPAVAALCVALWCWRSSPRRLAAVGAACILWPLLLFFWQLLCLFTV